MRTTDIDDLIKTVESIRKQVHADLDARFVKAIIYAEKNNPEDDAAALREIEHALNLALGSKGSR